MSEVIVLIPIYKKELTRAESASLKQVLKVCKSRNIMFIHPKSLCLNFYEHIIEESSSIVLFKGFDDKYFSSIKGYNQLLMSKHFYSNILEYKYLFIYQLDAWIFRDELNSWINKGYDNVGAPWFMGFSNPEHPEKITGAGNGGCCLRNVRSCIAVLNSFKYIQNPFKKFANNRTLSGFIYSFLLGNNVNYRFNNFSGYEDRFFADIIPRLFNWFKNCPPEEAMKFSFEVCPSYLFELNKKKLPMCCHAWEKYEPEFWKEFIDDYSN